MKILVIGGTGMAGHLIAIYLMENNFFVNVLVRTKNQKIPKKIKQIVWKNNSFDELSNLIDQNNYEWVINCSGILNKNINNNMENAILINSYLPNFLNSLSQKMQFKLIHLSTDCVFSGKDGPYNENHIKDGLSIYDMTKSLGEFQIINKNVILRNSIIGPEIKDNGIGFFHWFMKQQDSINGYENWIWSGITTLELAKNIKKIIDNNICGLFQLSNNVPISKYSLLNLINKIFNKKIDINKSMLDDTINKTLINNKIDFFKISTYEQQIKDLKEWIINHSYIYKYTI